MSDTMLDVDIDDLLSEYDLLDDERDDWQLVVCADHGGAPTPAVDMLRLHDDDTDWLCSACYSEYVISNDDRIPSDRFTYYRAV